jgi:hypothetical protein
MRISKQILICYTAQIIPKYIRELPAWSSDIDLPFVYFPTKLADLRG